MGTSGLSFSYIGDGWIHKDYSVHGLAIESSSSHQDTHYHHLTCILGDIVDSFIYHFWCNSMATHNWSFHDYVCHNFKAHQLQYLLYQLCIQVTVPVWCIVDGILHAWRWWSSCPPISIHPRSWWGDNHTRIHLHPSEWIHSTTSHFLYPHCSISTSEPMMNNSTTWPAHINWVLHSVPPSMHPTFHSENASLC